MRRPLLYVLPLVVVLAVATLPGGAATNTAKPLSGSYFEPISLQRIDLGPGITDASVPVFTHDGHHLLFFSGGHLWIVATTGGGPSCLTCGVANEPSMPVIEQEGVATEFPDGKRVFFGPNTSRAVLECAPSVVDCATKQILPVDFTGGRAPLGLAPGSGGQQLPSLDLGGGVAAKLAPDGVHVAFSDQTSSSIEEMILATLVRGDTSYGVTDPHVLNPPQATDAADPDPRHWSDGEALYEFKTFAKGGAAVTYVEVGSPVKGNPDVMELDLATGRRARLTAGPDWDEDDAPSPDGQSLVVESDRTMHRSDSLGLLPVRGFADVPEIAAAAGYFVGDNVRRQCDLQPWLLPADGDRGATLLGQPLQPYTGGDVHAANNVAGYPQWSPDGTEVALNTESYSTNASAPYLLVAHLTARRATTPLPVVSSEPGAWAPTPTQYGGSLQSTGVTVLHGLAAGTVTLTHVAPTGILDSVDRVAYRGYSDDGSSFTTGTVTTTNVDVLRGPIRVVADLTMTGAHTGRELEDLTYVNGSDGWTVTGSSSAILDGTEVDGLPPVPQPCPQDLPRPQPLSLTAHRVGSGRLAVHVQSTLTGAGLAENQVDSRPVLDATVTVAGRSVTTDAAGNATVVVPATLLTVRATAGDTMTPAVIQVRQ